MKKFLKEKRKTEYYNLTTKLVEVITSFKKLATKLVEATNFY